jgi:3-oxoadipate enol-lactonase
VDRGSDWRPSATIGFLSRVDRVLGERGAWVAGRVVLGPFHDPCFSIMRPRAVPVPMNDSSPTKTVEVPGGKIAFEAEGRGPPIVLLHEGIADRRMWNREFSLLARDHRVVRYDLRGYGGSTPATAEYSPVGDVVALLEHLDLSRPLVVGPSVGGAIALDLTLAFPKKVGALLLIAPGYSGMDYDHVPGGKATFERDERLSKAAADAWAAGKLEEATEHLRQLWAAALTGSALDLFRTMVRDNAKEVFEERSGRYTKRDGEPAAARLKEIHVPTRILVGDRDNPAMPHCANFLARGIEGATVELVPGADHLLNLSRPDAFDTALAGLAEGLPRARE